MDPLDLSEHLASLAAAADVWGRLGHPELVEKLVTLTASALEEPEPKPKPQPGVRHRK